MKEQDWSWWLRAQDSIAQGALTNSKRPDCFIKGVYHTHAIRAQGAFVWDASGKQLYDFICGMGTCLLGHGNRHIAEAIYRQAINGTAFSLGSTLEVELAEKIKSLIPWIQKVKFLKTGTEACMAAVKIARAKTGRQLILSDGYHGWSDEFVSLTKPALGVHHESSVLPLKYSPINSDVAAVIIEPVITDASPERVQYLRDLRAECTKRGALLIFDEVITGFRFPKFSVSQYFGIEPDLICLGKAMGGGLPLSCIGGKDDVMNCGEYFVSSTFAGETCSIAASQMLISQLELKKFNIDDLWASGAYFQEKFNAIYPEGIKIVGYPTRGVFEGDPLVRALLWQEAYIAGILFGSSFFINFQHPQYFDRLLNILGDIILRIKTGSVALKGEMPKSPFAQNLRSNS